MLTIFWDSQQPILETYQERGTTVTSATYCDMLQRALKPAIRPKRRGKLSNEILLLQDYTRPHTGNPQTIEMGGYGTPTLQSGSSSDFHLFGLIKEALRGKTIFM